MAKYLLVLAFVSVAFAQQDIPQYRAIAKLTGPGADGAQGNVTFTQLKNGKVHVEGTIIGLTHGKYGFHIHEKGDITGGCASAGAHFNPENKNHGNPNEEDRHVGDLGNIVFDEFKIGRVEIEDRKIALFGPNSILGRSVVLHEREDDFGKTNHPDSRKTGNAGGRVACGVIGILNPIYGWKTNAATTSFTTAILSPLFITLVLLY